MGLFDMGGDGGGLDALMSYLNPVGAANAQPSNMAIQPGGGGGNSSGMTPDQLRDSILNRGSPPLVPPGAPPVPLPTPPPAPPVVTPAVGTRGIAPPEGVPDPTASQGPFRLDKGVTPPPDATAVPGPAAPLGSGDGSVPMGDVGAALTGKPPIMAQGGDAAATKTPGLADVLKGVKAPAAPVLQKISSPSPPRPTTPIKSGGLEALLQALNAGGGLSQGLPLTLGGGRR